ncbi:MAG: DNRLRE domain-containing protein, partial [bacterium]|nr:DNRLRE domain-containing protein [bacterium]
EGATRYRVKRSAIPGGPYAIMDETSGTSYTDTRVSDGMDYFYTVHVASANGESAPSNEAAASPVVTIPVAPTNFTLVHHVDETRDEDFLWPSWTGSAGAQYYTIKKVMNPEHTAFVTIETNVHHPTEGFLRPDLDSEYVVCAVNGAGESPPSNPATINGPVYPGASEATAPSVPMNAPPILEITPVSKPIYGPSPRRRLSYGKDTYVRDGEDDGINFGTGDFLAVCGSDTPGQACRALIRFALDRGRVPEANMQRATLKVYCKAAEGPATITLYAVDAGWKETLVTWETHPAGKALVRVVIDKPEQWYAADVTEYVRAQHHADKTASFMLADDANNGVQMRFGSKEGDRFGIEKPFLRPVLEVLCSDSEIAGTVAAQDSRAGR